MRNYTKKQIDYYSKFSISRFFHADILNRLTLEMKSKC